MKAIISVSLLIALLFCMAYAEDVTVILNTDYYQNIDPQALVATEEGRIAGISTAYLYTYAQYSGNKADTLCGDFLDTFDDYWNEMKVAIGSFKKNFNYVIYAFPTGDIYIFEIIHIGVFIIPKICDGSYISVTHLKDKEYYYQNFDKYLDSMEKQGEYSKEDNLSLKFYTATAFDVTWNILKLKGLAP